MSIFTRAAPDPALQILEIDESHFLAQQVFLRRGTTGMAQADLAERAGMTQAQIAHIEAGQANPTHKTLVKLAYALDCNVRHLYEDDEAVAQSWFIKMPDLTEAAIGSLWSVEIPTTFPEAPPWTGKSLHDRMTEVDPATEYITKIKEDAA